MAEVAQIDPLLLDYVRQRGVAAAQSAATPVRPESLDLGERTRRMDIRSPFVLTCDSFARVGRYIVLWANPSGWQWQLRQRGAVQATRGGSVVHIWRSMHRPTYFDEPKVSITFQSGNIMPIRTLQRLGSVSGPDLLTTAYNRLDAAREGRGIQEPGSYVKVTTISPGLLNFYEFLEMMDEPKILDDGSMNYVTLIASTPMFPSLVLKGFFDPDGLSWQESAESDPNSVDWTAPFTVVSTYPALTSSRELRSVFEQMSGISAVNRVLIDPRGLRVDSQGNIDFNSGRQVSKNTPTAPGATDTQRHHPPASMTDPRASTPGATSWRESRLQQYQSSGATDEFADLDAPVTDPLQGLVNN